MLLALDLSSPVCTLALADGPRLEPLLTRDFSASRGRAVISELDASLRAANRSRASLRGIVVGIGPGSYTGLRIACTAARTLAWALQIPCGGLSSFAATAFAAPAGTPVHLLLDAYRGEIYHAAFLREGDELSTLVAPRVVTPEVAVHAVPADALLIGELRFGGPGLRVWRERVAPSASELFALARARGVGLDGTGIAELGAPEPLYLRPAAFPPRTV